MGSAGRANVHTGIDATELKELRKAFREIKPESPEWQREFKAINKAAGDRIAQDAGNRLASRGARGAQAGANIKGAASAVGVQIRTSSTGGVPYALAEVWGTKKRTGWYARQRYQASAGRQHPEWVGSSWEVGGPGEGPGRGPYGLQPAIHDGVDDVMDEWAQAVTDLMARFMDR